MAIYPWTKYNFDTASLASGQVVYGRFWAGGSSPNDICDPESVLAGDVDTYFDSVLSACNTAGAYFWYRQIYNNSENFLPGTVPIATVNTREYLDIADPDGVAYAVEVETYLRDYFQQHTYGDRFLVADSGAAGWLNEMNFPGTDAATLNVNYGWTTQKIADFHDAMVGVWGFNRMCSNMGGSSQWWTDYRDAVSASGIECVRQDAWGPNPDPSFADAEQRGSMYDTFISDIGYIPLCINLEVSGGGSSNQHWQDDGGCAGSTVDTLFTDHTDWTGMTGGRPNTGTFPMLLFSDMGADPSSQSTGYNNDANDWYDGSWYDNWTVYQNTLSNAWFDVVFMDSRLSAIEDWIVGFFGTASPTTGSTETRLASIETWITDFNLNSPATGSQDTRMAAIETWAASAPI